MEIQGLKHGTMAAWDCVELARGKQRDSVENCLVLD